MFKVHIFCQFKVLKKMVSSSATARLGSRICNVAYLWRRRWTAEASRCPASEHRPWHAFFTCCKTRTHSASLARYKSSVLRFSEHLFVDLNTPLIACCRRCRRKASVKLCAIYRDRWTLSSWSPRLCSCFTISSWQVCNREKKKSRRVNGHNREYAAFRVNWSSTSWFEPHRTNVLLLLSQ